MKIYNSILSISMIVGVVIGSGIFFKTDNILAITSGNVSLVILLFFFSALGIVFACLCLCIIRENSHNAKSIISYFSQHYSKSLAGAVGYFHAFVYYPALSAVLCYVASIYIESFLGYPISKLFVSIIILLLLYITNIISKSVGAKIQIVSTIIKLIPIILLIPFADTSVLSVSTASIEGTSFLLALIPVAFAFDGWIVATSLTEKTRKLDIVISPVIIFLAYSFYIVSVTNIISPFEIMNLGDGYFWAISSKFLGSFAKVPIWFVIVSVIGAVNGVIITQIQLPVFLAREKQIAKILKNENISAFVCFIVTVAYLLLHQYISNNNLLDIGDISEIPIVANYLIYILLYIIVIKLYKKGKVKSVFMGIVCPSLAILSSLAIASSVIFNLNYLVFLVICIIILVIFYEIQLKCCNKNTKGV